MLDEDRVARLARAWRTAIGHGAQAAAHPRHPSSGSGAAAVPLDGIGAAAARVPRRGLVDDPEAVGVERFEEGDGTIVLELAVGADDYGKVIGRGGRTAQRCGP